MRRLVQCMGALGFVVAFAMPGAAAGKAPDSGIPVANPVAPADGGFVAVGRKVLVRFGDNTFRLDFTTSAQMSFVGLTGPYKGVTDTVDYHAAEIRPNVYLVYWHELHTGDNVVHVEDYERHVVYTNIVHANGQTVHMRGDIRFEDDAPSH
ncbi:MULTISPECIES: hypothetical protein [unclassified Burkholderia]|uniref:MoaF-related domain-containing protein n=1 Tax=unclassified Burkholderia TaxID=2613784 RepID=UPI0014236793|nr:MULTISPECIES: hypothetical protein [unclassified Burkholderia]NIF87159.1 hypothetical protein [Burkholderia sp. Cy-637]